MKLRILRKFSDFLTSEEGKSVLKQENKVGSRLRVYKTRYKKDTLTAKSAMLIMIDLGIITKLIYKDFE